MVALTRAIFDCTGARRVALLAKQRHQIMRVIVKVYGIGAHGILPGEQRAHV